MGKGYALLFEQGCGKTLTAIAIAGRLYLDGKAKKMLVLAPLSVTPVWPKEIYQYAAFPTTTTVLPELGRRGLPLQQKRLRAGTAYDGLDIVVTNYESLRSGPTYDALAAWQADIIICDESQRIKNFKAVQSKLAQALGDRAKYKLILTGTPVCNTPLDFWSQYRFLDPTVFGRSWWAFQSRYAIKGGFDNKQTIGVRYLGELSRKAHAIASRVRKEDALDLPPYVTETYYCELEPATRQVYEKLRDQGAIELYGTKVTAQQVITQMLRLAQIAGGWLPVEEPPRRISWAKQGLCADIIQDILESDPHRKVVVFCRFVPEIKALMEDFNRPVNAHGFGVDSTVGMWGEIPGKERGELVERFQTDPKCRIFVAQTHTAGLGITLHAADTAIFFSPDFSYADYAQARDRIHRIGQTRPCTCIHLCARGTIDEMAFAAVAAKKGLADSCVDNWKIILGKG